jgi:hypothetical protein
MMINHLDWNTSTDNHAFMRHPSPWCSPSSLIILITFFFTTIIPFNHISLLHSSFHTLLPTIVSGLIHNTSFEEVTEPQHSLLSPAATTLVGFLETLAGVFRLDCSSFSRHSLNNLLDSITIILQNQHSQGFIILCEEEGRN